MKQALTIAGSDPGGGAGIQADIKTMHAFGVYATSAVTALTVQNTSGVRDVIALPAELVRAQCDAVFDDFDIGAVKTGMLGSGEVVAEVAHVIKTRGVDSLVVDPVMSSSDGFVLLEDDALDTMCTSLFPLARLVTPNLPEAEKIAGMAIKSLDDMHAAARRIAGLGPRAVLIKGGHAPFAPGVDVLHHDGASIELAPDEPIAEVNVHGTGCTFSAAIAAALARGDELEAAVKRGKRYITSVIGHARALGHGARAGDHFYFLQTEDFPNGND